jgi:hypothetical protein
MLPDGVARERLHRHARYARRMQPPGPERAADAPAPVTIGEGWHGRIELDPVSMQVRKRYFVRGDAAAVAVQVEREYQHLRRLSAALAPLPHLRCPEPLAFDPVAGTVDMTFCPGTPLEHLLHDPAAPIDEHLDHLARQVAVAADVYVREFAEPCYSLSTFNMLYDVETRSLTVLDFTSPRTLPGLTGRESALETSFACWIGRSLFATIGPRTLLRLGRGATPQSAYLARFTPLAASVLARLRRDHDLDLARTRRVGHMVVQWFARGGPWVTRPLVGLARRAWYATAGRLLYARWFDALLVRHGPDARTPRS